MDDKLTIKNENIGSCKIHQPEPNIIFYCRDNVKMIRVESNGEFFVKGKKVADDKELYDAMCQFFKVGLKK